MEIASPALRLPDIRVGQCGVDMAYRSFRLVACSGFEDGAVFDEG